MNFSLFLPLISLLIAVNVQCAYEYGSPLFLRVFFILCWYVITLLLFLTQYFTVLAVFHLCLFFPPATDSWKYRSHFPCTWNAPHDPKLTVLTGTSLMHSLGLIVIDSSVHVILKKNPHNFSFKYNNNFKAPQVKWLSFWLKSELWLKSPCLLSPRSEWAACLFINVFMYDFSWVYFCIYAFIYLCIHFLIYTFIYLFMQFISIYAL